MQRSSRVQAGHTYVSHLHYYACTRVSGLSGSGGDAGSVRLNTKCGSVVVDGKDMCRMTEGPDGGTQNMEYSLPQSRGARNAETSQEKYSKQKNNKNGM